MLLLRLKILRSSLASNRLRTTLASALVGVGIASTLIMIALGVGVRKEMEDVQSRIGRNLFVVKSGERQIPQWQGGGWYVTTKLRVEEASLLQNEIAAISRVAPVLERSVSVKLQDSGLITTLRGTTPAYLSLRNFQIESGRELNEADEAALARVAVVGAFIAGRLNNGLSLVGETLWLNGTPFTVVGQLRAKGQGSDGSSEDDQILVPLSTAMRRIANVDRLSLFIVQTKEASQLADAMDATHRLLRATHRLDADERDDFDILSMIRADEIRRRSSQWLQGLARILAAITLAIGGAGIFAVSYLNVKDRTGEIGLRMAIGASRASIAALFLAESSVISALGGVAGILLGAMASVILQRLTSWQMPLDARSLALSLAVSATLGVIFGAAPALQATRLRPAEALVSE